MYSKDLKHRDKYVNLQIIFCQVIVHHNYNLLIWDAILVDNLVCMANISLKDRETIILRSLTHFKKLEYFA